MKKKIITWSIIIVLVAGGVIYFLKRPAKAAQTSYLTSKIVKGDLNVTVTSTGTLNPDSNIAVGTQVSGIISKIYVDFNYHVKQGQLLALIDTVPLKEAVNEARAALEKAKANVFQTKAAYERTQELLKGKAAAQADLDLAEANYKSAAADQLSAEAGLDKAITSFKYAFIKAPISGTVVSRNVDVGQTVAASFTTPTLFMIGNDLTKMQVQASVDETDIGQVFLGQDAVFYVDAYPNLKFHGKVTQIRLQPTVTNNVVNYTVIIEVPNPDLKLLPGMTANITFNVQSRKDVLQVPAKALTFSPPGFAKTKREIGANKGKNRQTAQAGPDTASVEKPGHVWVITADSIKQVSVMVGISNGTETAISGPIKEGDLVATDVSSTGNPDAATVKSPFAPSFGHHGGKK